MKKKSIAILLILSLVLPMIFPTGIFAESVYKETTVYDLEEMKEKFLSPETTGESAENTEVTVTFPLNAAFAGVGTEMIFHLFRQGNTDKEQTVTLGTFDLTGEYGKHYEVIADGAPVKGKANPLLDGEGTTYNVYMGEDVLAHEGQSDQMTETEIDQQAEDIKKMTSSTFDLTFAPGESVKEIRVRAYVPAKAMGNREFQLSILDCQDMMAGEHSAVAVTLYDDREAEAAEVSIDPDSAKVEEGYLSVEVERKGNTVGNTVYSVSAGDGTAKNGEDFDLDSTQLTFTPGVTTQRIHIPLTSSGTAETKDFTLRVNNREETITYTTTRQGAAFKESRDRVDIPMSRFVRGGQTVDRGEVNFGVDEDNSQRYIFSFNSWPGDGDFRTASICTEERYDFTGIDKIRFSASYRVGTILGDNLCVYASNTDYYNNPKQLGGIGSNGYGNRIGTASLTGQGIQEVSVDRVGEYNLYVTADQHNGMGYIGYNLYDQDFDGDKGHFALIKKAYKLELVEPRNISSAGQSTSPAGDLKFTLLSDNSIAGKTIDKVYRDDTFSFTYTTLVPNAYFTGYEILNDNDEVLFKRTTDSTSFCLDSEVLRYIESNGGGSTVRVRPTFEREQAEVRVLPQDFAAAGMNTVTADIDSENRMAVYKDDGVEIATVTWDANLYEKGNKITFTVKENGGYNGDYHFDSFMMRSGERENLSGVNPVYYSNKTWTVTLSDSYYEITPMFSNENAPLLLEVKNVSHGGFTGKPKELKGDTYTVTEFDGAYETSDIVTFAATPAEGYRAKWTYRDVASNKTLTYYGDFFYYQVQFPVLTTDNTVTLEFEKSAGSKTYNFVPQVFMQGGDILHQPDEDSQDYAPLQGAQVTVDGKNCVTDTDGTGEVMTISGSPGEVHRTMIMANNRRYIHDFTIPKSGDGIKEEIKLSYYYEGPRVTSVRYYDSKGVVQNGDTIFLSDQTESAIIAASVETNNKEITDVIFSLRDADGKVKMGDIKGEINGNEYIWSAPLGTIAAEGDQIWVELQHREYDTAGNMTALTSYGEVNTGYSIVIAEFSNVSYVPDTGNTGEIAVPFWGNMFFNFSIKGVKPVITTSRSGNLYFLTIGISPNGSYNFNTGKGKIPDWTFFKQTVQKGLEVFQTRGDPDAQYAASQSMKSNLFNMSFPVTFQMTFYIGENPETLVAECYFVSAFFSVGVNGTYIFSYPFLVSGIPMFANFTILLGISDTVQIHETTDSGLVEINKMGDPSNSSYMPDNKFNVKIAPSFSVGVGVYCVASVSGGGTGTFNINWVDYSYGNGVMALNADIRVELLLIGRTFSVTLAAQEFFNTNPYDNETVASSEAVLETPVDEMVMRDLDTYQQSLMETSDGLNIQDAYDFSRPEIVAMEDGRYAVVATIDASYIKDYTGSKKTVMGYAVYDPAFDGGSFVKNAEGRFFNIIESVSEDDDTLAFNPKVTSIGNDRYAVVWNKVTYDGDDESSLKLRNLDITAASAVIQYDDVSGDVRVLAHNGIEVENDNGERLPTVVEQIVYDESQQEILLLYRTLDFSNLTKNSTIADFANVSTALQVASLKADDASLADEDNLWSDGTVITQGGTADIIKSVDIKMMKAPETGDTEVPVIAYHKVKGEFAGLLNEAEEGTTNHIYLTSLTAEEDGGYGIDREKELPIDTSAYHATPQLASGSAGNLAERNIIMWKQQDRIAVADPIAVLYGTLQSVSGEERSDDENEVTGLAAIHESFAGNHDDFRLIEGEDGNLYCFWTEGNGTGSKLMYAKLTEQQGTALWTDSQMLFETTDRVYIQSCCAVVDKNGTMRAVYRQTDLSNQDGNSEVRMKNFALTDPVGDTADAEENVYSDADHIQGIYASEDVQMSDISFEPLNITDGVNPDKYKVTATFVNAGDASSEKTQMVVSHLENTGEDMNETVLGQCTVKPLSAGEDTQVEFEISVDPAMYSKAFFKVAPVAIALYQDYGTADQNMVLAAMDGVQAKQEEDAVEMVTASNYKIGVGESRAIHAQIYPVTAAQFEDLTFESSDESIASVDENGIFTGVKKGNCQIIVTTDSGIKKTVNIQVTKTSPGGTAPENPEIPKKPVVAPETEAPDKEALDKETTDRNPSGEKVNTGDYTVLWIWVILALAAVAGINVMAVYKKKEE